MSAIEAKRQLKILPDVLSSDHWVTIEFPPETKKLKSETEQVFSYLDEVGVPEEKIHKISTKGKSVTFSFGVHGSLDPNFNGLVIGPDPSAVIQADRFRKLWGKDYCQLRRFPDGTVKESVQIYPYAKNVKDIPIKVDASDFILNQFAHLLKVHFPQIKLTVERPLAEKDLLNECLLRSEVTKSVREKTRAFVSLLQQCASDELPIKRAVAECVCLYGAHHSKKHHLRVECLENGEMKERGGSVPETATCLPVYLDITSKRGFDEGLFNRLSLYHLINLKKVLTDDAQLNAAIHSDVLMVDFKGIQYGVKVRSLQSSFDSERGKSEAISEMFQYIGTDHPCWWGSLVLAHNWMECNHLCPTVDEQIVALVLASAIIGTHFGEGASKLIQTDPPGSVEAAFLRFLYLLSFTDFQETAFILKREDCKNMSKTLAEFQVTRQSFPSLVIFTPHDAKPSDQTFKLDQNSLKKMVNAARVSLFEALKSTVPSFKDSFKSKHQTFDALIKLKHPCEANKKVEPSLANFDGITYFLDELQSSFSDVASFHVNKKDRQVGVKIFNVAELDVLLDDIQILGRGFVSDVIIMKPLNK